MKHHSLTVAITIMVLVFSVLNPIPVSADGDPPTDPGNPGLAPTDFPVPVDPGVSAPDSPAPDPGPVPDSSDSDPAPASHSSDTDSASVPDSAPTGLDPTDFPVKVDPNVPAPDSAASDPLADPISAPTGLQPTDFPIPVDPAAVTPPDGTSDDAQPAPDTAPTGLQPTDFPLAGDPSAQADQPQSVPEILASIPPQTDLALVDANGQPQPLSSEAGAQILVNGDPTWCPDTATPLNDPTTACVGPYDSFSELIDNLVGISGSGTIYVASNLDSSPYDSAAEQAYTGVPGPGNIIFDPGSLSLTDLTIQGGWNFASDTVDGTSTIDGYGLKVGPRSGPAWNGNVTINDLVVQNAPDRGIEIVSSGNIILQNVTANQNNQTSPTFGVGIYAEARGNISADSINASNTQSQDSVHYGSGAALLADGSVSVSNSQFDGNTGFGLRVVPGQTVQSGTSAQINTINATNNVHEGLQVYNNLNVDNVISVQDGTFSGNGFGVLVNSVGSANFDNLWVETSGVTSLTTNGSLVITNSNIINNFGATNITGGDVTVSDNFFNNNASTTIIQAIGGVVSVSNSSFDNNADVNMISATNGVVINSNSSFSGNDSYGLIISGDPGYSVDVSDSSFNANVGPGLSIFSHGNTSINNISAQNNIFGAGAEIWGSVSPNDVVVNGGNFNYNGDNGIKYFQDSTSSGNISLNGIQAIGNQGSGAYLSVDNGTISIAGGNFNGNSGNGIYASASGDVGNPGSGLVTVANVTASGNSLDGAGLESGFGSNVAGPLTVTNSVFNSNGWSGLYAFGSEGLTLNQITAIGNGWSGAELVGVPESISDHWISVDNGTLTSNGEYGVNANPDYVFPPGSGVGTLYLNNLNLRSNGLDCYHLIEGSAVTTNVLCAFVGDDSGDVDVGDDTGRVHPKQPPVPAVFGQGFGELRANGLFVVSGTPVPLDCRNLNATFLKLADGAGARYSCPVRDKGMLTSLVKDKLPGDLPSQYSFVESMSVDLIFGDAAIPSMATNGNFTVQFPIPPVSDGKNLAIMFWDPSLNKGTGGWVELPTRILNSDGTDKTFPLRNPPDDLLVLIGVYQENGLIKATTNFPGVFMLVTK